jgi:WD40 repeat protein
MEFLQTSWIFKIPENQFKYNVNLCVMGGNIVKTIQTNSIVDIEKACQHLYRHYDADLDKIPIYSEEPYTLVVTKQCWLRHAKTKHVLIKHSNPINCVAFHPSGGYMISKSRGRTLRIWDTTTWKSIQVLNDHVKCVHCVAFHPLGKFMVSGSADRTLRVWD